MTYTTSTSGQTKPIRDMTGNWSTGMSSIRFITKIQKNSDIRNGM